MDGFCISCQVDGVDLKDATHEEAVNVIRNANSPVTFVVRSLPELLDAQNPLNLTKSDSDGSVSLQVKYLLSIYFILWFHLFILFALCYYIFLG